MHETEPSAQRSTFKRFSAQLGLAQYFYQGEVQKVSFLWFTNIGSRATRGRSKKKHGIKRREKRRKSTY